MTKRLRHAMVGNLSDKPGDRAEANSIVLLQREARKRQIYVWCVVFCAAFLGTLLFWPIQVSSFKLTSKCEIAPNDQSIDKNEQIAHSIIRDITSDQRLKQLTEEIESAHKLENPFLKSSDWEQLRESIKVSFAPVAQGSDFEIHLSIIGKGTADERVLINHLTGKMAAQFAKRSEVSRLAKSLETIQNQLQRETNLNSEDRIVALQQLGKSLQASKNQYARIKASVTQAIEGLSSPSINDRQENPEWNALQRKRSDLRQRRKDLEQLYNWTIEHEEIANIQRQIDSITRRLEQIGQFDNGGFGGSASQDETPDNFQKNRFALASATTSSQVDIDAIYADLNAMDFTKTSSLIDGLQAQLKSEAVHQQELVRSLQNLSRNIGDSDQGTLRINSLQLAHRKEAIGAVPNSLQLMLIGMLSVGVASVVAWKFEPGMLAKPFVSGEKLEAKMGLPLLGTITTRSSKARAEKDLSTRLVFWTIRISETLLLVLVIGLVIACLIQKNFIVEFISNPLNAIATLVAQMFGA